jgi:hypothetical protein
MLQEVKECPPDPADDATEDAQGTIAGKTTHELLNKR